jgi:tRNA-splicing endonuclease subunit Sen15
MSIPLDEDIYVTKSPLDATIAAQVAAGDYHNPHLLYLALQIQHNLQYQHRWVKLKLHQVSPLDGTPLARPLISGLPPRRLYVHPDEQIELLRLETERSAQSNSSGPVSETNEDSAYSEPTPEFEWVLPTHIREEWSLGRFAESFASIGKVPPDDRHDNEAATADVSNTAKRMMLAILQDDSTIVYYFIHDGTVKPRQN